jgi:acyl-CoA reductase-like NAD-dependent aldehyde dehydrogenase
MLTVTNPFDGSVVGEVALADEKTLEAAVAKAQAAFAQTRRLKPFERASHLARAAELLRQQRAEIASLIVAEAGKPITLAEAEVDRGVITLTAASEAARSAQIEPLNLEGFAPGKGHVGFVKRFPIGVIYGITPFNFPLNLVMHKVAPAVASGNAIIIKPSPRTPLTALRIERIMRDAGCPQDQVQVVVCPNELAMKLVEDQRIAMISFTGSAPIGWQIRKRAAARRVTLELGGNAALIIHDDADLVAAVPAAAAGAFGYAGQTCISVQRILIHEDVYARFREMLLQHVREKILTGDPRERTTTVGPMINQVPTWRSDIMPYGGVKESGLGREGVRYAMDEMTEMRTMVMKVD